MRSIICSLILAALLSGTAAAQTTCTVTMAGPTGGSTRSCTQAEIDQRTADAAQPVVIAKSDRLRNQISQIADLTTRRSLYAAVDAFQLGDVQTAQDIVNNTSLTANQKTAVNAIFTGN